MDRVLRNDGNEHHWNFRKVLSLLSTQGKLTYGQCLRLKEDGRPCPKVTIKHRSSDSAYELFTWICGDEEKNTFYCWPCLVIGDLSTACSRFNSRISTATSFSSADQSADSITDIMLSTLEGYKVVPDKCGEKVVGQSYDGAPTMSGNLNGVQKQVQEHFPAAYYNHCVAHRMSLCASHSAMKTPENERRFERFSKK
eukprot:gene924-231_t